MSVFAPAFLGSQIQRESTLFCNNSSKSPRDHSFPALCSSEDELSCPSCSFQGTAAGELQLHRLRDLEMWVKIVRLVISTVVISDPVLRGGDGSRRLQVQALDTGASQQMVAPANCEQNVWGEVAVWVFL